MLAIVFVCPQIESNTRAAHGCDRGDPMQPGREILHDDLCAAVRNPSSEAPAFVLVRAE
jgi:hypothetical protein